MAIVRDARPRPAGSGAAVLIGLVLLAAGTLAHAGPASHAGAAAVGPPAPAMLSASDLPAGFEEVPAGFRPPGSAGRVFWRPEALGAVDPTGSRLFGASSSVETFASPAAALARLESMPPLEHADARKTVDPTPCTLDIEGIDLLQCRRVVFELEGIIVVEYRFRMLAHDRIAVVHLSARVVGEAEEPPGFRKAAVSLARRQADRLLGRSSGG